MSNQSPKTPEKTSPAFIRSEFDDAGLTPTQFRVYCHIVRRAGGIDGAFYESNSNCASHCQIHIKTLRAVIAELLRRKMIALIGYRNGGTKTYRVTCIEEWKPLPNGYPGIKLGRVSKWHGAPAEQIPGTPANPIPETPTNRVPTKVIPVSNSHEVLSMKENPRNFIPD